MPLLQSQSAQTSWGRKVAFVGVWRDVSHCLGTTCFPLQNLSVERTDLLNETRKSHLVSITKIVLGCHGGPIVLVLIKAAEDQNHLLKLKG